MPRRTVSLSVSGVRLLLSAGNSQPQKEQWITIFPDSSCFVVVTPGSLSRAWFCGAQALSFPRLSLVANPRLVLNYDRRPDTALSRDSSPFNDRNPITGQETLTTLLSIIYRYHVGTSRLDPAPCG
jgi:hypothetical protein